MSEATFPVLGAAFVFAVVLPLSALAARLMLSLLERRVGGSLHGLNARFIVLVGSSMVPVTWFLSAGLHQVEEGSSAVACLLSHELSSPCLEPGLFAAMVALVLVACWLKPLRALITHSASASPEAAALSSRLGRLIETRGELQWLTRRILVTDVKGFALATEGLFKPTIVIGTTFASKLDDASLLAAIGHEAEHVRSRDPLRYLLVRLALSANPLGGWLLSAHAARWLRSREAHCDREAVIQGAAPLSLAEAIVQAARPTAHLVALGAPDATILKFRVGLLCAFAEVPPTRCCQRGLPTFATTLSLLVLPLLLPHQVGAAALDVLHTSAEQSLTFFTR